MRQLSPVDDPLPLGLGSLPSRAREVGTQGDSGHGQTGIITRRGQTGPQTGG
jgi:hypothetical protein